MLLKTDFIIQVLKVVSWVIFIALCIQTGAILFNYCYSLLRPIATHNLYLGLDLSSLYGQNKLFYTFLMSFMIGISALKAYCFYLTIQIFFKLNLIKPFSEEMSGLISKISRYIFFVGFLGLIAHQYTRRLIQKGFEVDGVGQFWDDSGAFLMMAAIVFVIAQIFKKGIELQNENDLTV